MYLLQCLGRLQVAGNWYLLGATATNVYRHASDMIRTRTLCVDLHLTSQEIQVLVDQALKELATGLLELDRLHVQRLGDPEFQGEELNQDDLKIVENYSLQIETSQGRSHPPVTGIPSLDGVRATPGDTRDRIVGALGRLGLPTDGSGAASITGRRVMRYLFTEILNL